MDEPKPNAVPEPEPPLQALENQINLLTELSSRVESLRRAATFLRPPGIPSGIVAGGILPLSQPLSVQEGFVQLRELADKVQSDSVQNALKVAKESASKDTHGLSLSSKRRQPPKRPLSPDSPQPTRPLRSKTSSLFPSEDATSLPLRVGGLIDYLQEYNQAGRFRLQIWTATTRTPDQGWPDPTVVRFIIRDVATFYLTVGTANPDATIVVESATAFGSREKKPPHSQSDYIVFQKLSQHLAKMLQSNPQVSFQLMVQLLASYEDLFVRPCTACQRVISAEGHVPPVARVWIEAHNREAETSRWDARHPACAQN